jgi:hypothetical protein
MRRQPPDLTSDPVRDSFADYLSFPGWDGAPGLIGELIERERPATMLEVGAGRSPTLPLPLRGPGPIRYTINDAVASELDLAGAGYEKLCFDMSAPLAPAIAERRFDLIFSRMVNEHVVDGRTYHANVRRLLNPGGLAVHMFATLWSTPFVLNMLLPESVTHRLLAFAFSQSPEMHEKFPARYRWCRGPTDAMRRRFTELGFEVEEYRGYFGHGYYSRIAPLHRIELAKTRWLLDHPLPALTSYAMVVLRRTP